MLQPEQLAETRLSRTLPIKPPALREKPVTHYLNTVSIIKRKHVLHAAIAHSLGQNALPMSKMMKLLILPSW